MRDIMSDRQFAAHCRLMSRAAAARAKSHAHELRANLAAPAYMFHGTHTRESAVWLQAVCFMTSLSGAREWRAMAKSALASAEAEERREAVL